MSAIPIFNSYTRIWFIDRRGEGSKRYGLRVSAESLDVKRHSIEIHLVEPVVKAPGKHTDLLSFVGGKENQCLIYKISQNPNY